METISQSTKQQDLKIQALQALGYTWDKADSVAAAGVVFKKDEDVWFFGLQGEITHNPQGNKMSIEPKVLIFNDYDGFFERWAHLLAEELERLGNTEFDTLTVDSGPYRDCGLSYMTKGRIVHLDFYAAVRNGFGSIGTTAAELAKELLKK